MTKPHDPPKRRVAATDGERGIWRFVLLCARALAAVLFASGLLSAAASAVFVSHSTPGRGHVVSRTHETTDYPVDLRGRGLQFLSVTISNVEIAYVERDGRPSSAFVPESACWRVDEQDVPIRHDFALPPHVRVDTFFSLWGEAALKLFLGAALITFVELLLK